MNIEIFKRNIQLTKLGIGELVGLEKKVYDFLMTELSDLNIYRDMNPKNLYYGKSMDSIVLNYELDWEWSWVDDKSVWKYLVELLGVEFRNINEIELVLAWWIEYTLGFVSKKVLTRQFELIQLDLKPL